ncbi:MAG: hypothetical protein CSA58_05315, partial [Micrococcales bacterium]
MISRTDPLGTVRYGYDRAGHQIRTVDVDGQETAVRVDATGRVVGVDVPGASADARYAYTPAGLVTKMTDATGTTRFSYDARGLTTQVVHTPGTGAPGAGSVLKYGYDETGRLTSLTYPNGATLTRGLDAAGRLTSITDPTAGRFNLTWGPDGNLATITYPNGVVTTADVDSRGLTTTLTIADDAGAALLGMAYDYDAAGQQTSITTTRPHIGDWPAPPGATTNETSEFSTSSQYTFDPLGRLDQVTGDGAGDVDFAVNGVLTALPGLTLTHNQLGQAQAATRTTPTAATTWDFSYDPAGRQTTRTYQTTPADPGQPTVSGQVTLTWDTAGHLMTWADTPAGAAEPAEEYAYTYTGDGLRRTTTHHTAGADPATDTFVWSQGLGGIPVLLTDGQHRFVYGAGMAPLAQITTTDTGGDTGRVAFLHTDTLGSVRAATNTQGEELVRFDYDTHGYPTHTTGDTKATKFGYAGEYTDPTGLTYLRARYYDPGTGVFLTRDPLLDTTRNPYGYTGGNPLQHTDPTGLDWRDKAGQALVIGFRIRQGAESRVTDTALGIPDMAMSMTLMGQIKRDIDFTRILIEDGPRDAFNLHSNPLYGL